MTDITKRARWSSSPRLQQLVGQISQSEQRLNPLPMCLSLESTCGFHVWVWLCFWGSWKVRERKRGREGDREGEGREMEREWQGQSEWERIGWFFYLFFFDFDLQLKSRLPLVFVQRFKRRTARNCLKAGMFLIFCQLQSFCLALFKRWFWTQSQTEMWAEAGSLENQGQDLSCMVDSPHTLVHCLVSQVQHFKNERTTFHFMGIYICHTMLYTHQGVAGSVADVNWSVSVSVCLQVSMAKVKQVGLLAAGCQPWNKDVCAASGDRFAYCATLAIYIYQVYSPCVHVDTTLEWQSNRSHVHHQSKVWIGSPGSTGLLSFSRLLTV